MAAIGAAAVTLGACAETPKNTVEIHPEPTTTATATATASAPHPHASATASAKNPLDDDELNSPGGPGWHRHRGGQCGPNGQCPPYGGAPPFDDFV